MTLANPEINYEFEQKELRKTYISAKPQIRLNVILKRIKESEIGPMRLLTLMSSIEALSRSLLIHAEVEVGNNIEQVYEKFRLEKPEKMVEKYFRKFKLNCNTFYKEDTWLLFKNAIDFRNLIIHECTYLGKDKYQSLIMACEEVLSSLIELAQLKANN